MDQEHVLVDEVAPHQRPDQLPAAEDHEVLPGCSWSPATASAASPSRRVELRHGSGSWSVVDATYFWVVSSTAVKGFGSGWWGQ